MRSIVMRAGSPAGVKNGFSYVLAPQGVRPGDTITSGPTSAIHPGNTLPLSAMPIGQQVYPMHENIPAASTRLCWCFRHSDVLLLLRSCHI